MARIRSLAFVLCSLTLLVGGTAIQAQPREQQSTNLGVTGQITAIDSAAKTLTVVGPNKDGGVFVTNRYTTIMNGDKGIGLNDLKKGWHVAVSYDQENGKNVAQYVTVVDTGP
jgi:hypothetical protein